MYGVLGRRENEKREIKLRKPIHIFGLNVSPNTCIGFRDFISLFSFSLLPSKGLM
jgi:hypothetical protein